MPVELRVPQMGESISEATVLLWLKKEGESFAAGEDLVELETDKANSALSAEQPGILTKILHKEGEVVGPNDVLAELGEAGSAAESPTPTAKPEPVETSAHTADNGRPSHATPLAAKVAAAQGVDLSHVQGTGISGRILTEDVNKAALSAKPLPDSTSATILTSTASIPPASLPPAMSADTTDDPRIERRPKIGRAHV